MATRGVAVEILRTQADDPCLHIVVQPGEEEGDPTKWMIRVPLRWGSRTVGEGDSEAKAIIDAAKQYKPKPG